MDVPGADPTKVAEELAGEGVVLDTLGGDVLSVETAAPSGKGIAELEEAVVMQAETMGLRARREGGAVGTVVSCLVADIQLMLYYIDIVSDGEK